MFELTIKKQGVVTNGPSPFETLALAEEHVAKEEANKTYGETDKWVKHEGEEIPEGATTRKIVIVEPVPGKDAVTEEYKTKEAVIDEETGEILEPAEWAVRIIEEAVEAIPEISFIEYFIPKKYEIIIEDKTAEYAAAKLKEESIKLKKEQAELALKSFDINKIKDADVRQAIQFILDKIQGL